MGMSTPAGSSAMRRPAEIVICVGSRAAQRTEAIEIFARTACLRLEWQLCRHRAGERFSGTVGVHQYLSSHSDGRERSGESHAAGGGAPGGPATESGIHRLNEVQYQRIRDFLVLHYCANSRVDEPFWDFLRSMELPDTLEHKLSLFRARARLPSYQYGLFSRDSWLAVLIGQGIEPQGYDPLAEALPLDILDERLRDFRARIATNIAAMTPHGVFVADYCGGAT